MRLQRSSHQGCVVLTLAGRLDLGAGVFTSLRHPALGWPGTALVLCGARPAVADVLMRQGIARRLAMHPNLDQALRHARARPPRLRERLALGPVPGAGRAGRAFVREVCGRWGLEVMAEPAALLASELVTNAVLHARTSMELWVELRGPRLHLAVQDQDPNLAGLLAAKDRTYRGLGLSTVNRMATAWGVRHRPPGSRSCGRFADATGVPPGNRHEGGGSFSPTKASCAVASSA